MRMSTPRYSVSRKPHLLKWAKRFWGKIAVGEPHECWEWKRALTIGGYGKCRSLDGRTLGSHRLAYITSWGPVPDGMSLDHLCKNRKCCNPSHLEVVTPGENTLRGDGFTGLNKRKTHCKYGHALSGENLVRTTKVQSDGTPVRLCRECGRRNALEWYHRITKYTRQGKIPPCKKQTH